MKNIHLLTIGCFCSILFFSCKKDQPIGPPVEVEQDYTLPQGNASQAANDKIQALFNSYGSYFLYNFTQKDFEWVPSTGTGQPSPDSVLFGNPQYAEDMLKFLDDVWLKFLPESMKKTQAIPYRVFMCDTIRRRRPGTGYPPGQEFIYTDFKINGKSFTFTGMNANLRTITPAQKLARKITLTAYIWKYYLDNGIIDIPQQFYNGVDYVNQPVLPLNAANPNNVTAYRNRGFLPGSYNPVSGVASEWLTSAFFWTSAKTNDASSYILAITSRTDAQMEPYFTFPFIKQRFDLLVNYYKTKYGIDVRAIANATY